MSIKLKDQSKRDVKKGKSDAMSIVSGEELVALSVKVPKKIYDSILSRIANESVKGVRLKKREIIIKALEEYLF